MAEDLDQSGWIGAQILTVESETVETIPDQSPLFQFQISENNLIELKPSPSGGTDVDTVAALRDELLDAFGPLRTLLDRYQQNPNTPQCAMFGKLTQKYFDELNKDIGEINFAVLYARGARFYGARETAKGQIRSGEWPEMEPAEEEAINAICEIHGPLIMATSTGRKLVADAYEYAATPDEMQAETEIIAELGRMFAKQKDMVEPKTGEAIVDVMAPVEMDRQPGRSSAIRIVAAGSALTVLVGTAALLSAYSGSALLGLLATQVPSMFLWEIAKKTRDFKTSTDKAAKIYNDLGDKALDMVAAKTKLSNQIRTFVQKNDALFEKISRLRPEFGWAGPILKGIKSVGDPSITPEFQDLTRQTHMLDGLLFLFGNDRTEIAVAEAIARKLDVAVYEYGPDDTARRRFSRGDTSPIQRTSRVRPPAIIHSDRSNLNASHIVNYLDQLKNIMVIILAESQHDVTRNERTTYNMLLTLAISAEFVFMSDLSVEGIADEVITIVRTMHKPRP